MWYVGDLRSGANENEQLYKYSISSDSIAAREDFEWAPFGSLHFFPAAHMPIRRSCTNLSELPCIQSHRPD